MNESILLSRSQLDQLVLIYLSHALLSLDYLWSYADRHPHAKLYEIYLMSHSSDDYQFLDA